MKRGDTLYKIALDNGLDYRELAAWNAIENVNLIREGQSLRLTAPGESAPAATGVTTTPLRTIPPVTAGDGLIGMKLAAAAVESLASGTATPTTTRRSRRH